MQRSLAKFIAGSDAYFWLFGEPLPDLIDELLVYLLGA